jgi:hypothetical protein
MGSVEGSPLGDLTLFGTQGAMSIKGEGDMLLMVYLFCLLSLGSILASSTPCRVRLKV